MFKSLGEALTYREVKGWELWKIRQGTQLLVDVKKSAQQAEVLVGKYRKRVTVTGLVDSPDINKRGVTVTPAPLGTSENGFILGKDLHLLRVRAPRREVRRAVKRYKAWVRLQNESFHWGTSYR